MKKLIITQVLLAGFCRVQSQIKIKFLQLLLMITSALTLSGCSIGEIYYGLPRRRREVTVVIFLILIYSVVNIIVQAISGKKKKK